MIKLQEFIYFLENGLDISGLLVTTGMSLLTGVFIYFTDYVTRRKRFAGAHLKTEIIIMPVMVAIPVYSVKSTFAVAIMGVLLILYFTLRFFVSQCSLEENMNLLWASVSGILTGEESYLEAALLCVVVFAVMLILGRIRNDSVRKLIIEGADARTLEAEGLVFRTFHDKAILREKFTDSKGTVLVYEIPEKLVRKAETEGNNFTQRIRQLDGIRSVRLIQETGRDEK